MLVETDAEAVAHAKFPRGPLASPPTPHASWGSQLRGYGGCGAAATNLSFSVSVSFLVLILVPVAVMLAGFIVLGRCRLGCWRRSVLRCGERH